MINDFCLQIQSSNLIIGNSNEIVVQMWSLECVAGSHRSVECVNSTINRPSSSNDIIVHQSITINCLV